MTFAARRPFCPTTANTSRSQRTTCGGERFAGAANLVHEVIGVARGPRNAEPTFDRQRKFDGTGERNAMSLGHVDGFDRADRTNRSSDLLACFRIDQGRRGPGSPRRLLALADEKRFGDADRGDVQQYAQMASQTEAAWVGISLPIAENQIGRSSQGLKCRQ